MVFIFLIIANTEVIVPKMYTIFLYSARTYATVLEHSLAEVVKVIVVIILFFSITDMALKKDTRHGIDSSVLVGAHFIPIIT